MEAGSTTRGGDRTRRSSSSSASASGRRATSARHKSSKRAARAKLVRRRLKELGIVISTDQGRTNDLYNIWIAKAYAEVALPQPWSEYSDDKGRVFYYNHVSGVSKWEHPLFNTFRGLLERSRLEPDLARTGYFKDLYYKLRKYCIKPSKDKDKEEGEQEEVPQIDETYKGWWALNLLAATSSKRETGPPPAPEEVRDMCTYLGIDTSMESGESGLAWIAKQAIQAALPPDWYEAEDEEGNNFYFNAKSGDSSTSHPLDEYFLALVKSERRMKQKLEHRRQTILAYTSQNQDDRYSGRLSIALFEGHWESIRADWVPFIARKQDTYWYNFRTDERIHLPFWEPRYRIAGRKIVRAWKRYLLWKERRDRAAVCIQSNFRRFAVQSAVLLWQESCAAVCIQCYVRRLLAQNVVRRERAAIAIQRAVREYLFIIIQEQHIAATVIQSHVRKILAKKARKERIALKKKKEARLRIQANMRRIAEQRIMEERMKVKAGKVIHGAYSAYRLRMELKRRIQRKIILREKQEEYIRKYRSQVMSRKATKIQSMVRAFLVKKEVRSWSNAARIIQTCFRQYLVDRRERVRNLIHLYYDVHATRIQKRWKFFSHWKAVEIEENAATVIQKHFRSYLVVNRKAAALSAIVRIQANFRRWKRWREFQMEKAAAEQRAYAMKRMQPYCHALGIAADYVLESAGKKAIDEKARALSKLVEKRKNLHLRAMGEIARICASMDPADMQGMELGVASKGSPGWLSDQSMADLKTTLKKLTALRDQHLNKILLRCETKVAQLCDELKISPAWRAKNLAQVDKALGVKTLNYLEILYSRLRSVSELAKSLAPLVHQVNLFKASVETKEKVADFKKKEFPLVLRTLTFLMQEIKKHRAKDYHDICVMLDLPKFKEIERLGMLANFYRNSKASQSEEGKPKKPLRRPTLGGRSTLFAGAPHEAPTTGEEPKPPPVLPSVGLKKRPKRKKRASVLIRP
ncbi:hypothetical protein HOP50_10g59910 [Chloropicon primus]|uniref:WW domain-containing protein n=1 Tax=Chloropicon primus TaxID=1764295 RepID=A0A5B8MVD0_9CHLO|nr:hypothetical protein A3770_10p59700 [Chloropicon primus]UPR02664.1 hypothetical protein HOP50_10g59910 [Chloropicon primus]|eukprot:QDZ23452.1 hypothetical protein A3770_10p59700 [Chloropicon primus]